MEKRISAIILAGGQGRRMNNPLPKQYMLVNGKPVLYYSLKVFEESSITDIIVVTGKKEAEYCQKEIVEKYSFTKVRRVTEGGKERCDSVYRGLLEAKDCDYVLIHDGARPFVTKEIIEKSIEAAVGYDACVAGMPIKDTIKIANEDLFAEHTPDRSKVWIIQTPQAFAYPLIRKAYDMLQKEKIPVTDDAMVAEHFLGVPIKLIEGSYTNIKITTPEDLQLAELICKGKQ